MKDWKISASMICADQGALAKETQTIDKTSVEWLHIDVMDGRFVPRLGMYPEQVKVIRRITNKKIDAHMMVVDPEPYISVFADAGLDLMSVHIENNAHINRTIGMIGNAGMESGIILNTSTDIRSLEWCLDDPNLKLIMLLGINPGILGQDVWNPIYAKGRALRTFLNAHGRNDILIQVDGSVKKHNSSMLVKNCFDVLVCGSSTIFRPKDGPLNETIRTYRDFVNSELRNEI